MRGAIPKSEKTGCPKNSHAAMWPHPEVLDIQVLLVEVLVAEMLEGLVLVVSVQSVGYQGN